MIGTCHYRAPIRNTRLRSARQNVTAHQQSRLLRHPISNPRTLKSALKSAKGKTQHVIHDKSAQNGLYLTRQKTHYGRVWHLIICGFQIELHPRGFCGFIHVMGFDREPDSHAESLSQSEQQSRLLVSLLTSPIIHSPI